MIAIDAVGRFAEAAVDRIAELDGRFLLPALVLQLGTLAFKSAAWRNVLVAAHPGLRPSFLRIASVYVTGAALNAFTPARGGDVAKVVLARRQLHRASIPSVAGALMTVSALDAVIGFSIVVTLWATGVIPAVPAPGVPRDGWTLALLGLAVCVVAGLALRWRDRAARLARGLVHGFAVLRMPGRYLRTVVPLQLAGWGCRIGVVLLVLAAFRIEAGLATAALVVTLNGAATAVPVPGGAGSQQVLAAFALRGATSAAGAISFSLGLQVGITLVNTTIGIAGAMLLFRTMRPGVALRAARQAVTRTRHD